MRAVPFPAIEKHGLTWDGRSAAVIAADGTVSWMCLPRFDGAPLFGALLDVEHGGYWRLGPAIASLGEQHTIEGTNSLSTVWSSADGRLELIDTMTIPEGSGLRAIVRRLRCDEGAVRCFHGIDVRQDFGMAASSSRTPDGWSFETADARVHLRFFAAGAHAIPLEGTFMLHAGESLWVVLALDERLIASAHEAEAAVQATGRHWKHRATSLYTGPRREAIARSNLLIHALTHAPTGAPVAAATASVPERIGGDWNADYRFTWIRDASLSLAVLALLGNLESATRYMDWLASLEPGDHAPLQVLYRVDGSRELPQVERPDVAGYRNSKPVRFGNHAASQRQLDAFGFLCDCAFIYLDQGGAWKPEYWDLVRRAADHVLATWHLPDNSLWEVEPVRHYVSGKVMAWVALERTVRIARALGHEDGIGRWSEGMRRIHDEVMLRGWSERLESFRQHYDDDTLDASALLVSVMDFLPADHPRVLKTIECIETELSIDGFVYRFDPRATLGPHVAPLGEFEAAFLPCTFWLATAHAKAGNPERAEAILGRAERIAGSGWFAEAVDPREMTFRGNFPLLFSQVEYVRAALETAKAHPLQMAQMLPGVVARQAKRMLAGQP